VDEMSDVDSRLRDARNERGVAAVSTLLELLADSREVFALLVADMRIFEAERIEFSDDDACHRNA